MQRFNVETKDDDWFGKQYQLSAYLEYDIILGGIFFGVLKQQLLDALDFGWLIRGFFGETRTSQSNLALGSESWIFNGISRFFIK
jgi:hypothetical protein